MLCLQESEMLKLNFRLQKYKTWKMQKPKVPLCSLFIMHIGRNIYFALSVFKTQVKDKSHI